MNFSLDRFYRLNRKVIIWVVLFALIYLLRDFFMLIFLTFVAGFFAFPAAQFLMDRLKLSRTFSIVLVYLGIFFANIALYAMVLPSVVSQASSLQAKLPSIKAKVTDLRDDYVQRYSSLAGLIGFYSEPYLLRKADVDWARLCERWNEESESASPSPGRRIQEMLTDKHRQIVHDIGEKAKDPESPDVDPAVELELVTALNNLVLKKRDYYRSWDFGGVDLYGEGKKLLGSEEKDLSDSDADELQRYKRTHTLLSLNRRDLSDRDVEELNRRLLDAAYPHFIAKSPLAEDPLAVLIDKYYKQLQDDMPRFASYLLNFFVTSLLAILFGFLIAYDYSRLSQEIKGLASSRLRDFFEEAGQPVVKFALSVGRGFRAVALIALITTLLMLIPLFALRVPNVALLSLTTFVTNLFPVIGVVPQAVALVLVTLNERGIETAGWMFGAVMVIHILMGYIIGPYIFGREFKLNPVAIIFILYIGHAIGGVWGMMLGVPVANYLLRDVLKVPMLDEKDQPLILEPPLAQSDVSGPLPPGAAVKTPSESRPA